MTHVTADPRRPLVYRYVPPDQVVARAVTYIGDVLLEFTLRFTGSVTVTCSPDEADEAPENRPTLQLAGATLHRIADGLFISTVASDRPTIRSSGGHSFLHCATSVAGPRTRRFSGECRIEVPGGTGTGEPAISGSLGYALDVRAVAPSDPPDQSESGWLARHNESFASIGAVVLQEVEVHTGRGARLIAS